MARKRNKSKGRSYGPLQEAKDLANLQYGPQQRSLLTLLRDLRATRDIEVGASQGLAQSLSSLAEQQRQPIGQAYDASAAQVTEAGTRAQQAISGIKGTPQAASILAAIAAEPQRASTRIASERGAAVADIGKQQQQALASGEYGVKSATRQYRDDRRKVEAERQGLFKDKGKFISTQFASLTKAEQAAALDRAGFRLERQKAEQDAAHDQASLELEGAKLDETRRHNQAQERKDAREKRKGSRATPEQQAKALEQTKSAKAWFNRLERDGWKRRDIYQALREGKTVKDDDGNVVATIPKLDHDYINAGADLKYKKKLSPANKRAYRQRGLKIPKQWR